MMVSASQMLVSSLTEQLTRFSVVNIPLTSRYAHSATTRDCFTGGKVQQVKNKLLRRRITQHLQSDLTLQKQPDKLQSPNPHLLSARLHCERSFHFHLNSLFIFYVQCSVTPHTHRMSCCTHTRQPGSDSASVQPPGGECSGSSSTCSNTVG